MFAQVNGEKVVGNDAWVIVYVIGDIAPAVFTFEVGQALVIDRAIVGYIFYPLPKYPITVII